MENSPPRQLVEPLTTHFANKTTNRDKVTTNSNSIIFGDYSIILRGTTNGNKWKITLKLQTNNKWKQTL